MKLHLAVALIGLVFLESTSYAADSETDEVVKRRGWGKRDSYPIDALAVDAEDEAVENELEKRRGWESVTLRNAGAGANDPTLTPLMTKWKSEEDGAKDRRLPTLISWTTPKLPSAEDGENVPQSLDLASELSQEMDKRRGWAREVTDLSTYLMKQTTQRWLTREEDGVKIWLGKTLGRRFGRREKIWLGKACYGLGKRYVQRFSLVQNSQSSQLNKVLNS